MQQVKNIFKNPALIGYLVKKMLETYPGKQVGKDTIQKLIYFLVESKVVYFNYSMFHFGPFSSEIAYEMEYAENLNIIDIMWKSDHGFFITPSHKIDHFEDTLSKEEKKQVDNIVKLFGSLSNTDISILATTRFLFNRFETPEKELPMVIHYMKPKYTIKYIEDIIGKYGHIATGLI